MAKTLLKHETEILLQEREPRNIKDTIMYWITCRLYAKIINFIESFDIKKEARKLNEAIDAAITLSVDRSLGTCGVNHKVAGAILKACEEKHSLMKVCAQRIGHFLRQEEITPEAKNAIAEIINELNWLSLRENPRYNFAQLLTQELPAPELIESLKGCYGIYHMSRADNPHWFENLKGDDVEISRKLGLTARGYSPNWYYLEQGDRLVGIVMAAYSSGANAVNIFIYIFEQADTGHGIGTKIIRWIARDIISRERRATISLFYPAAESHIRLFLKCWRSGFVDRIEAISSSGNRMGEVLRVSPKWAKVESVDAVRGIQEENQSLFIRAVVEPEIKTQDRIFNEINSAA